MTAWIGYVLLLAVFAGALAGIGRLYYLLDRNQRRVSGVFEHDLDDLDGRPEFAVPPADWPLRESPQPQRTAVRS